MGFFTSDSIFETSLVSKLEELLSSYAQPIVDVAIDAANHPLESVGTALTIASEFVQDNPYTTVLASIGGLALLQMYRKNALTLNLGSVYVETDTVFGGASFGFHLGRNNNLPDKMERELKKVNGSLNFIYNNLAPAVKQTGTQTNELYEEIITRRRSKSTSSISSP